MKTRPAVMLLVLGAALFGAGIVYLLHLRVAAGDVYPPYSSLRADPLGTQALYEALARLPGVSVRRDYSSNNRLPAEPGTTYLHLAGSTRQLTRVPEELRREISAFTARGGRLVIALSPQADSLPWLLTEDETEEEPADQPDKKTPPADPAAQSQPDAPDETTGEKAPEDDHKPAPRRPHPAGEGEGRARNVSLWEKWGVELATIPLPQGEEHTDPVRVAARVGPPLPGAFFWHSPLVFKKVDDAWRVIYVRDGQPVVIERAFGRGSVVLATDSYFLSNEAVSRDRQAGYLAWLLGPNRHVVFDEAHLGVVEESGVALLLRQYRLQGLLAGLLVLAGLFIWKNSSSLLPPAAEQRADAPAPGRDAAAGFLNLLHRHIPPPDLLAACLAEWDKSRPRAVPEIKIQQIQAVVDAELAAPPRRRDPLAAYRKIAEILRRPAALAATAPTQQPPLLSWTPNA